MKIPMPKTDSLMTAADLAALAASRPPREMFGPNSNMPFVAFYLDGAAARLSDWLRDLPCPVVGVGAGELAWACDVVLPDQARLGRLGRNIRAAPLAAMILVQQLRLQDSLDSCDALLAESFAYGALQNGPEFRAWLSTEQTQNTPQPTRASPLQISRQEDVLRLTLNKPAARNAIDISMRDALCEALDLASADDEIQRIDLTGAGAAFSVGGDVAEFGQTSSPATAHWVRSLRLPAWRLVRLRQPLHVHVNGAAIGAGAEIAAFATRVTASDKAWFQLPELKYGLIPGAGGTVSLPRRIGRQQTAYLALSMERIRAEAALELGLIDEIL